MVYKKRIVPEAATRGNVDDYGKYIDGRLAAIELICKYM